MSLLESLSNSLKARGVMGTLQTVLQGRVSCYRQIWLTLEGKSGLEIGGPSKVFRTILPIYQHIGALDNCVFASETLWAKMGSEFRFGNKAGKNLFREGSDLSGLSYDFILASHMLEHCANPVKSLLEWRRVAPYLVLILPEYRKTFDHQREVTAVNHMWEDFENRIGEDDLTHADEFIRNLDLKRNPQHKTRDDLAHDVRNNFRTRCMHHHVFDEKNSVELLASCGYELLTFEFAEPHHMIMFARAADPA